MARAIYTRVSTNGQNLDRQLKNQDSYDYVFSDKISGATKFTDRPSAKKLIALVATATVTEVVFHSVSRIGRNFSDCIATLEYLKERCVVRILDLNLDSTSPAFNLVSTLLMSIEADRLKEIKKAQMEGIAVAKKRGVYNRNQNARISDDKLMTRHKDIIRLLKQDKFSIRQIAKMTDKSTKTVMKIKSLI